MTGKNKKRVFMNPADRVWKRIHSWDGKLLSRSGKEVLLKAVAQAIPTYTLSVFQLPASICEQMNKHVAGFWWSKSEGHKGFHWVRWSEVCKSKLVCGLGFHDFRHFNQALLAKIGWWLLTNKHSLLSRMLSARYLPSCSFVDAQLGNNPSYIWHGVMWSRELLLKGGRWRVGNGNDIYVYQKDCWVLSRGGDLLQLQDEDDASLRVCDLMEQGR